MPHGVAPLRSYDGTRVADPPAKLVIIYGVRAVGHFMGQRVNAMVRRSLTLSPFPFVPRFLTSMTLIRGVDFAQTSPGTVRAPATRVCRRVQEAGVSLFMVDAQ